MNSDDTAKAVGESVSTCPRCRAACRPHAKFCPICGNSLMHIHDGADPDTAASAPTSPAKSFSDAPPRAQEGKARFLIASIFVLALLISASVAYLASFYYQEEHRVEVVMQQKVAAAAGNSSPAATPSPAKRDIPEPPPMPVSRPPGSSAAELAALPVWKAPESAPESVTPSEAKPSRREVRRHEAARVAELQRAKMEQEAAQAAEAQRKRADQEKIAELARKDASKPAGSGESWKQACDGMSAISRLFCLEKARWEHCRDRWNTTPECVANNPAQQ